MTVKKAAAKAPAKKAVTNGHKPKAGAKDFDWQTEYPGEDVFVYTSPVGTTIGLAKLGPQRRPKPGKLALLDEEGNGVKVLWYFLKVASSDTSRLLQADLDEDDYADMCRQWAKFAGVELGE